MLLSLREIDTVALLDLDEERIVWAVRGPWLAQHDPDILANGNILLFDNLGNFLDADGSDAEGGGGRSRILEFDPSTMEIAWQYAGTDEEPFESDVRASQERLANGNTLITEETRRLGSSRSRRTTRSSGSSSIRCAPRAAARMAAT